MFSQAFVRSGGQVGVGTWDLDIYPPHPDMGPGYLPPDMGAGYLPTSPY